MAFISTGSLGSAQSKTAGTPPVATLIRNVPVGHLILVGCAVDNTTTTDGQTSDIGAPTDSQGHTYTKIAEFTNGQGSADAGATVALWYAIASNAMTSGVDTITGNFNAARAAQVITAFLIEMPAGSTIQVAGTVQTLATDGADPASMSISGLTSKQYLFVRITAGETSDTSNWTATNYALWSGSQTAGGGAAGNMAVRGASRILTATGDTLDPTWVASDNASIYVAIQEVAVTFIAKPPRVILQAVKRASFY